ncbi:MAG: bifunctional adenosylcobinamide kinase/adenosylcobinamide-phosphate guanylyltransferase [Gammaproteobacteria bacterium]|nr:bifunctional adenosylcobinamide kinase/adenosylcobinamide-phosphate guanylyltransferase [Gammaproteobacteria bacterium]
MKTLILGGVRSGKSRLAEQLAAGLHQPVTVIVTGQPLDEGMRLRIEQHRAARPARWQVIEEPLALADTIAAHNDRNRCLVVDCLTLWLTNLLCSPSHVDNIRYFREQLLSAVRDTLQPLLLISNETGLGIMPDNDLARRYGDESGLLHQQLAACCDTVILTVAGLPLYIKGKPA